MIQLYWLLRMCCRVMKEVNIKTDGDGILFTSFNYFSEQKTVLLAQGFGWGSWLVGWLVGRIVWER